MGEQEKKNSFFMRYILSSIAAATAETVTFPLDITKTRLQLQREAQPAGTAVPRIPVTHVLIAMQYRGMLRTGLGIVQEEGVLNLWRGLGPAILRHLVYSGSRMGLYEQVRIHLMTGPPYPLWQSVLGGRMRPPTCSRCAAGMGCGAVCQFIASPTDLVKVRLQMEGKRILQGHAPRYHVGPLFLHSLMMQGTIHAFQSISAEAGILGMWRGCLPNVQRAALVNLGDLTTYDTVKRWLLRNTQMQDDSKTHILSSLCAGVVAATLGTPADVIKSRVMNQPIVNGRPSLYRGAWHCLVVTVQREGLFSMWSGFLPCWLRMAPWSLTFWLTYERIRKWSHISSF